MTTSPQFPYVVKHVQSGIPTYAPYLPMTLSFADRSVAVSGLLDTGAALSVLPYDIGLQLGADWNAQTTALQLIGNLAAFEARAIVLLANVGGFPPVRLAFAWSKSTTVPLLLGQVNFFQEFNVCFFLSRTTFEVQPK